MKRSVSGGFILAGLVPAALAAVAAGGPVPMPPGATGAVQALLHPLAPAAVEAARASDAGAAAWRPQAMDLAPARWIWLPSERTPPSTFVLFRREFELPSVPARAPAWITADSRYRLTVNGARVQWGPAPCDPRALDVDPVDLAPYLKPGRNVLGVEVLFYGQGDGTWPGGKPGLIFHGRLEFPGEAPRMLVSDAEWRCLPDRAHAPGRPKRWFLRALQEEFDARLHPYGWDEPSFRPGPEWVPAAVLNVPADKPPSCGPHAANDLVDRVNAADASLRARQIPPTADRAIVPAARAAQAGRVGWKRDPADWFDFRMPGSFDAGETPVPEARDGGWTLPATAEGEGRLLTFEFERQVVGWPAFTIDAPAGTVVELLPQEAHDPAKALWMDNHFFAWTRFICREGVNRFETFDYESLRWLQLHVRNASRPVTIRDVGVRRRTAAWPHEPVFRTSEAPLQRLFDASVNTLLNSAIETCVDGMGRERQQYSGDGGHQMHAIRAAFGEPRLPARYLRTFSEGLCLDGYFMDCWPAFDRLARIPQREVGAAYWGPLLDHGVGFCFDNWNHYLETGDLEATTEPYPRLVRFAGYLESIRGADGLLPVEGIGIPQVWMDHNAYRQQRHRACSFNLYAAAMFEHALAPLAEAWGDVANARRFREDGRGLREAAVRAFWDPEKRLFVVNRPWLAEEKGIRLCDRSLATAVLFDQCPGGETAAAVKALAECPPEMGFSYPCNAGWRLWALAKAGRADAILSDLRGRWVEMESVKLNTTLQEGWHARPDSTAQWSHCPLAPLYVTVQDLAGIRPLEPGYRRMQVRPQLGDLPDLEVVAHTPPGPVRFRAAREGSGHRVELAIPTDCEAELVLPADAACALAPIGDGPFPGLRRYRLPPGVTNAIVVPAARVPPAGP